MRPVGDATRHCEQCSHEVHDLNAMTEAEARALLHGQSGARVCVRYQSDRHGRIQFADTNTRGPSLAWTALGAAASLVALVACTSHGPPALEVDEDEPAFVQWRVEPAVLPERPETTIVDETIVDVEIPCAPRVEGEGVSNVEVEVTMGKSVASPARARDFSAVVDMSPTRMGDAGSPAMMGAMVVTTIDQVSKAEQRRERRRARRERRRQARRH